MFSRQRYCRFDSENYNVLHYSESTVPGYRTVDVQLLLYITVVESDTVGINIPKSLERERPTSLVK